MASSNSCFVGVDLGGTTIKFALIDNDGNVLHSSRWKTDADEGYDAVMQRMIAGAQEMIDFATDDQIIRAVGVAVPGVIDMDRGYTIFLPNLPGDWPNVPVVLRLPLNPSPYIEVRWHLVFTGLRRRQLRYFYQS